MCPRYDEIEREPACVIALLRGLREVCKRLQVRLLTSIAVARSACSDSRNTRSRSTSSVTTDSDCIRATCARTYTQISRAQRSNVHDFQQLCNSSRPVLSVLHATHSGPGGESWKDGRWRTVSGRVFQSPPSLSRPDEAAAGSCWSCSPTTVHSLKPSGKSPFAAAINASASTASGSKSSRSIQRPCSTARKRCLPCPDRHRQSNQHARCCPQHIRPNAPPD